MKLPIAIAALVGCVAHASALEIGVSGPGVWMGDVDGGLAAARAIEATGAGWARINFRLDLWSAPDDATPRGPQMLSWLAAYDRLVDELTTHGVQVYGLIGTESVPGDGEPDSDDWVQRYTTAAQTIIDHFKDRVRVYELFNEPNNYRDGTTRPAIAPYYLAKAWQQVYLAVKFDGGRANDACDQVTLVSGGLFSFEGTDATDYLKQVYQAGRTQLAWDWMHQNVGSYPLDAVGYHIYVGQGASETVASVQSGIATNLGALVQAVDALEGGVHKQVWLSEIGWSVDQVSVQQQADFLTAGFESLAAEPRVAAGLWFSYQDFPGGAYGLYTIDGLDVANRRQPTYDAFAQAAARWLPGLAAQFSSDSVPATLTVGESRAVTLAVRNRGSETWRASDDIRLGAGAGCPAAAATNQLAITPGPSGGYAQSPENARLFLDPTQAIATGTDASFSLTLTAPTTPGTYLVALRMVAEGRAWFGDTFRRVITVLPASANPDGGAAGSVDRGDGGENGDGGSGQPGIGCGCHVSRTTSSPGLVPIFLVILLVLRRRARV